MKTGADGKIRVLLVDESGRLRYLGVMEEPMKAAANTLSFSPDPVRGGT